MKTSKKLLSFFLAVVMVVTTCSVGFTAFAQDNKNSIWSTNCDAEAAFDTLNGLADDYLPGVLMGIDLISSAVYEKFAKQKGGELTDHEKAVIASANEPGTETKAVQTDEDKKNGIAPATLQDMLAVLQPVLLNLLASTSQEDFVKIVEGSTSTTDPSSYDYLLKYKTNENGNIVLDEDSMTFFTLYALCKEHKDNEDLKSSTRKVLADWYEKLDTLTSLGSINADIIRLLTKHGEAFDKAHGVGLTSELYESAPLIELEMFYNDDYIAGLSNEDKQLIDIANERINTRFKSSNINSTSDSLASAIYYQLGAGRSIISAYNLYELINSTGTAVTFTGTADITGAGELPYDIKDNLAPDTVVDIVATDTIRMALGKPSLTTEEAWQALADSEGMPVELAKAIFTSTIMTGYDTIILPQYEKEILIGLAIKNSDKVNSVADVNALAKEAFPDKAVEDLTVSDYSLVVGNLLDVTVNVDEETGEASIDYRAYINAQLNRIDLTDEQKEVLYGDYDLANEVGTDLLNTILNSTVVGALDSDMVKGIVGNLLGDVDLVAAVKDIWSRLYNSPVATIFELVPLVVTVADSFLVPLLFNSEGDQYHNFVYPLVQLLLPQYTADKASYIGIHQIGWDLNELVPDLMNWLFDGRNAEGIEYYSGETKFLTDDLNKPIVYSLSKNNLDQIDFDHFDIIQKDTNNKVTVTRDENGAITSYTFLGETSSDLNTLLAAHPDTELVASFTYSSDVPYFTGIYIADQALMNAKITDLEKMLADKMDGTVASILYEVILEVAQLFRVSVQDYVNSDLVNQTRYTYADVEENGVTVTKKVSVTSGLNNLFIAIPQLFDIMENHAADKYGVSKDAWVYCSNDRIYQDEDNSTRNKVVETFKAYANSSNPDRAVDILDTFADLLVGDWLNAIVSLVNNAVSTDNKISNNIPIVTGLLNALGGFGETSIITDILNGVFQIDRASDYSFTFEKHENGFTGLSKDNAYFLITNIKTLVTVVTNLIDKFGSSGDSGSTGNTGSTDNGTSTDKVSYKPRATKAANADKSNYTNKELSNAADLINNFDKMISSLLSDSSLNGFNLNKTDNIFAGLVTFFSNYLGNDCFTDIGKLLNSYVFYITGSETHTPDAKGNVDAKKVYTNEALTGLVVETFLLIEKVVENLLADYSDVYTLDNGAKAQYNLLVEAIEGLVSPDAIAVRLTGYNKVQKKLADYNCWHNAAAQTSRGDYKIKLDWGIKAGDKDAFYDGLAASLRLVTSILGVVLIDTNWYGTILQPILGALCTKNGIKVDTVAQYKVTTNGYHDEALLGILRPVSEWFNLFLNKPATTLIKSIQGIAGILDDKNGATIKSIINGAVNPLVKEIKGLGNIFAIDSDVLRPTSPTLQKTINGLADMLAKAANPNNIKLGQGNYRYTLTGANIIPIINSYLAGTGIALKQINWNKLSNFKTPAAALVYIVEYLFEVILDNDNLSAIAKLIGNDTFSMIIDLIKSGNIKPKDILELLDRVLEATDSPTMAYWTFSQYLQEAAVGFYYPAGITKQMADNGVKNLDQLIAGIFPLLSSFGVDLGGNDLQAILSKNLFKNSLITTIATALYGALDGLDPTIKDVLKGLGIVTSTKDVAKLLTDKSYGATFSSAAKTIGAQSSWKNVKNVNWGFTDGSAKAQQGFVNALAAVLRPLNDVLNIFLNEGALEINEVLYNVICSLDIPYTVQVITLSDSKDAPIQLKLSYRMKNGVLRIKFREYEENRERSRSSELRLDFTSLKDLKDLKLEGTNGYNSAIIPLLEAFQCSNIPTYAQYHKDAAKAKDNILLNILNPLIGDSSSSFLNKLVSNPVSELTKLLPNIAMYLESDGLVQLISNLLAPVTYFITDGKNPIDLGVSDIIEELLGAPLMDMVIPLVNDILEMNDINIKLADINWNALISLGDKMSYTSKATGENGKFLTGKMVGNVDQGKVLVTVLRYVANVLVDNASALKNLICSIDGIKNSDKADLIISIITSVFNTIGTATADQIVAAIFFLLDGQPQNAFWDYSNYKTGSYSFAYPEGMDVDFLKQLPPMLDGLIGGLADLNSLIGKALFKDELITKLAKGLYGAIEGVKINDNLNLTQLLSQTDIDFSTGNVAKLLVDEKYGQKFESAASVISAAGSWKNVNESALKWGVTDRDSFFHALVAVLRPLYGVLDVLLNDAYLGLFDLVRIPGSNGYTSSIVPLMEAFSMYNIKTQYQYRQDISKEYDAILLDIINPIWDLVEDVLNAPLQTIAAIVPNLALFIGNDGLCQILDNLLTPVSALLDTIRPVVDLNDLLPTLFKALKFDLNGTLAKIGITNFSLDIYDLNKTLKQVLAGDQIIPLVNNILGMIDIKGAKLDLKLNPVDWLQLASHGTTIVSSSQAATYGARVFVQGDSSETLIAVLRYLINTVNSGDNFSKISTLIGGLLGDGVDDNISGIITQVLGMLQGDTDTVISSLVDLLQELGG